jgi:hypothetical protein
LSRLPFYEKPLHRRDNAVKRRWVLYSTLGAIALAVLLAKWLTRAPQGLTDPRAAGITRANFDRILEGSLADEVNRLFGVPSGDYRSKPGFLLVGHGHIPWTEQARGGKVEVWYVPRSHVEVLFDRNGRVVGKYWYDNP